MNLQHYNLLYKAPTLSEYLQLRKEIGWSSININLIELSLKNSLFHITIRIEDNLVGMARIIGDNSLFFYIQDVIVAPKFQGLGYGTLLMKEIETYLEQTALTGATIGLFAAKGKEGFYSKYKYLERTGDSLGLGMCKFV